MTKIYENQKLGEIVSIFRGSEKIFNKYKIDYCCGGHDTLSQAVQAANLNLKEILAELNSEYELFIATNTEFKDWRNETPTALIEHILDTHHEYTKKELREIDFLMFKILKVHFEHNSEELLKVHRLFGLLKIELEQHLVKEEENLFPLIEEYEATNDKALLEEIKKFVIETEDEHTGAGDILKEISTITNDYKAPAGTCTTYKLVYAKLEALEKDLFTHIYLENSVLFEMLNLSIH